MTRSHSPQQAASFSTKRLRRLAKAATPGPWRVCEMPADEWLSVEREWHDTGTGSFGTSRIVVGIRPGEIEPAIAGWKDDLEVRRTRRNAAFIAAANPAVILALLDRLEVVELQLVLDAKNCATYHVDESIYDADLAAANRRIEDLLISHEGAY